MATASSSQEIWPPWLNHWSMFFSYLKCELSWVASLLPWKATSPKLEGCTIQISSHCATNKILTKKSTLQTFFVIWFIHSFVSHYLLSASSFVRLLGERHEHNQSEFAKKLYSDYWPKIFLLSSPNLCLTSLLLSKQITSDSKKHWVSCSNFIFSFILFLSVLCCYSTWI